MLPGVGLTREGLSCEVSVRVYVVSICESILWEYRLWEYVYVVAKVYL